MKRIILKELTLVFQFTLPRGERLQRVFKARGFKRFNSRSREGSDLIAARAFIYNIVSIHAPARGATYIQVQTLMAEFVSIHAPARGATHERQCS